ncbi:MAG: hypothetical protein V4547_17765 [Bacteroidota bacterium]
MKRIISILICFLVFSATQINAQVSDNRVDTYWAPRVVPVKQYRDSTWLSFWNKVTDGIPSTPLTVTPVKIASYTVSAGEFVPLDATLSSFTITLPSAPANKTQVGVKMVLTNGTNTVQIRTSGSDVFNKVGGGTTISTQIVNQGYMLQYNVSTGIWYVMADDLPLSGLDTRYWGSAGNSPTVSTTFLGTTNSQALIFKTNNTERFRITETGPFTTGTLTYTDVNTWSSFQGSANNYYQSIWQNSNSGSTASTDLVLSNNLGTSTSYYGNFGINSSGFTGSSIFAKPSAVYLTGTTSDLAIGTTTNSSIYFATDGTTRFKMDSVGISRMFTTPNTSTINGAFWYDNAFRAFTFYHSDGTGSTNNAVFKNAMREVGVFMPATTVTATNYGVQFTTSDATGLGFAPNGNLSMGVTTTSAVITQRLRLGNTTTPTSWLSLMAGSTATSSAPMKFTSGALQTTPEVGAVEFLTDQPSIVITTGAARKNFVLSDITLTSGRVPFSTTNGRMTDLAAFTYATNRLSPTYITLAAGTTAAGTAPLVMTSGALLTTPIAGAIEFLTDQPSIVITTGAARKNFVLSDITLTSGRIPFNTTNGRVTDATGFLYSTTSGLTTTSLTATSPSTLAGIVNTGNITLTTAGNGITIKTGVNASVGTATLVAGTIAVANTNITANSRVFISPVGNANAGLLDVTTSAGVGFTIRSASPSDVRPVYYWVVEGN